MHSTHNVGLRAKARKQCPRCLWSGKFEQLLTKNDDDCQSKPVPARRFKAGKVYDCFCCSLLSGFFESQGLLGRAGVRVIRGEQALLVDQKEEEKLKSMLVYTLPSDDEESTASLPFLPHRLSVSGDTSSAAALSWVQRQIDACLNSHEHCKSKDRDFLPTRLLSVRPYKGSPDVQLVNSKDLPSSTKYIALSHCWGKFHIQCLTRQANLSQQLEWILWGTLTRTFQDAVDFTRRLSVEYIWIDSMCIIQDDGKDWLHEASMMFSVYNNAHVTLVGAHAKDGSVGMYSKGAITQTVFPRTITHGGRNYQLYTREDLALEHIWLDRADAKAPLFRRAWCFQELIISPRVIFFKKEEIVWECFSRASCECTGERPPSKQYINNLKIHHFAALADDKYDALRADIMDNTTATSFRVCEVPSVESRGLNPEQVLREFRVHQWHSIVEQYSELELTKHTDRLPAVGGIAQHYHKSGVRAGERYLAGLWSGSLVEDLLWWATEVESRRLGAAVAPSWSWASVSGAVQYFQLTTILAEVLSVECQYPESGPFSVVTGGTLYLKGPTLTLTLRAPKKKGGWRFLAGDSHYGKFSKLSGTEDFMIEDQADPALKDGRAIHAIACAEEWDGRTIYLLFAECDSEVHVYTRVGILFLRDRRKTKSMEE